VRKLRIRLQRGVAGCPQDQKETVRRLGLRRREQVVEQEDTPVIRGMINKVRHLVSVEDRG